jgi:hypothetical protein
MASVPRFRIGVDVHNLLMRPSSRATGPALKKKDDFGRMVFSNMDTCGNNMRDFRQLTQHTQEHHFATENHASMKENLPAALFLYPEFQSRVLLQRCS